MRRGTAAPRVLVMTLPFGSGHVRAARAIVQALARQDPAADVRVVDALAGSRWAFRACYVWPYWLMIRYAPQLWRMLFAARLRQVHRQTAPAWSFRVGCAAAFESIAAFDPDVIVAAEIAACEIAVHARRRGLSGAAIVNVITDHHAEPAWVQPEIDVYAVADATVRKQLVAWGAPVDRIVVAGIPTDAAFRAPQNPAATRVRHGAPAECPLVLLMGGGMGPTRMDQVVAGLCASGRPLHIVAVAGHDRRALRRLVGVHPAGDTSLSVVGWTDDVPALMHAASILVTKPGGVTSAEAAVCGVPAVMFDPIPGLEEHNAAYVVAAGAGVLTHGSAQTVTSVLGLLHDEGARAAMAGRMRAIGTALAAATIADAVLLARRSRPVLILSIANGAGHTRVAEAIAQAVRVEHPEAAAMSVDVADYMSFALRLTHVILYLWLVKYAPALWDRIDRYQKGQPHTSPEWYYRRGCRRLFDLVRRVRPHAIVATEVGCAEVAALLKRDLGLAAPLVAVNGEYDADRAWIQPEVDAFVVPTDAVADQLRGLGAPRERVHASGVPLHAEFAEGRSRDQARAAVCRAMGLAPTLPIVLISGGSEGLGRPDRVAARLLRLEGIQPQLIVLTGRNPRLSRRCERVRASAPARVRVVGWTSQVGHLMLAADVMVSKPGHTFDEAIASGLPLVSLPPPPGSERVQYRLLDEWNVGRAVGHLEELAAVVARLLADDAELAAMRASMSAHVRPDAAASIARWISAAAARTTSPALSVGGAAEPARLIAAEGHR